MNNDSYLTRIITQQEHFVAGRIGDGAQFPAAGIHAVRERITDFAGENVLSRYVLTEPVEDVQLLRFRRVHFVLAVVGFGRNARSDRTYSGVGQLFVTNPLFDTSQLEIKEKNFEAVPVVCLIGNVQNAVRSNRDG